MKVVGLAEWWSFPMEEEHNAHNRLDLMIYYLGRVDSSSIHTLIMAFMCRSHVAHSQVIVV